MSIQFQKGLGTNTFPSDGVVTQDWIDNLSPCDLVNPYSLDDPEVLINASLTDIPLPGSPEFEAELVNVARAVHLAKQASKFDTVESEGWEFLTSKLEGKFISKYLRQGFRINEGYQVNYGITDAKKLAYLVHADYPTQLINDLWRSLRSEGAKIDKKLFDAKPYGVFTNGVVGAEALLGLLVRLISPTAFAHKYHHKRPRPEEVIKEWCDGTFAVSPTANEALEHYVNKEDVSGDLFRFTMYPEGAPNHPALPAMHSAVAAMALVVSVVLDLTPEQELEAAKYAANIAFGRTFAGVHYRLDNLYGLELGERAAAIVLPEWMKKLMGAIPAKVSEKIELKRNNWL